MENLATYIEWDTTRANDFRSLATAVYCMSKWPHLTSAPSISALEKWLHEADELDEEFEEDVKATFQIFCELAQDQKLKKCFWLPGVKKVAPVEVLAISLLIYIFKRKMSLPQLSEAQRLTCCSAPIRCFHLVASFHFSDNPVKSCFLHHAHAAHAPHLWESLCVHTILNPPVQSAPTP